METKPWRRSARLGQSPLRFLKGGIPRSSRACDFLLTPAAPSFIEVLAFRAHGSGSMIWKLLVGLAYLFFGGYLILHPVLGVASLTLVLASLFLIEGVLNIILFFKMRPAGGTSWVLVDGIVTLLLGLMIYMQWPLSSFWAIGILVGVSMIISGVTRVMLSLAVRKVTTAVV
jgi:uncharacterized membrane protein HdeD (DUF308 family)